MGRPSLAKQRKQEILEAFGRCVARYGLDGSSLEQIAEEAGMKRSILRHYIGNRDELVIELARKVIADYTEATSWQFSQLKDRARQKDLVDLLLPKKPIGSTEHLLILENLIGAAPQNAEIRSLVFDYIERFVGQVADQIQLISGETRRQQAWQMAYALVCISFNQESLQPLDLPPKYLRAARSTAYQLLDQLS